MADIIPGIQTNVWTYGTQHEWLFCLLKKAVLVQMVTKFHYAILVADRSEAGRRPASVSE